MHRKITNVNSEVIGVTKFLITFKKLTACNQNKSSNIDGYTVHMNGNNKHFIGKSSYTYLNIIIAQLII